MIRKLLFETGFGNLLLTWLERQVGLAVVEAEQVDPPEVKPKGPKVTLVISAPSTERG